jgi:hypothetical protein
VSDIPGSTQKIQIEGTRFRSAVSEDVAQKMGGAINYLLDDSATQAGQISSLNTRVNQAAVTFGPISDTLTAGPGTTQDSLIANYTTLKGRPVEVCFQFGTFSAQLGPLGTIYSYIQVLRGTTVIGTIMRSDVFQGTLPALTDRTFFRDIGTSQVAGVVSQSTAGLVPTPQTYPYEYSSVGGNIIIRDVVAAGSYTYNLRLGVGGTSGSATVAYGAVSGFVIEV